MEKQNLTCKVDNKHVLMYMLKLYLGSWGKWEFLNVIFSHVKNISTENVWRCGPLDLIYGKSIRVYLLIGSGEKW